MLIYNAKPAFCLKDSSMDHSYDGPDQVYYFDSRDEPDNNWLAGPYGSAMLGYTGSSQPEQEGALRRGGEDRWVA